MKCPIPVLVTPRPPKVWTASIAVCCAHFVLYILSRLIGPASFEPCSSYDWSCRKNLQVDCVYYINGIYHVVHLIRDVLKPVLHALRILDHLGQLGTNDGLFIQKLAENFALRRPS